MITLYFFSLTITVGTMFTAWIFYLLYRNKSIVDVFWPFGIWLVGVFHIFNADNRSASTLILFILLTLWMLRLSGYLMVSRILKGHHDKRYDFISDTGKPGSIEVRVLINYMVQAFLQSLMSLPLVMFRLNEQPFSILVIIGIVLVIIGLAGETLADISLQNHKKLSNGVCWEGLWNYSRHPNYFFDWLMWVGFAVSSVAMTPKEPYGVIAPLTQFLFMYCITIPISEKQSLRSKHNEYERYRKKVSKFFPLPRR